MKYFLTALATLLFVSNIKAQISITSGTLTYTQNFNALDTLSATPFNTTMPSGWSFFETGSSGNTTYRGGAGTANSGDTYSFGTVGTTERALGSLASGSVQPYFGARFVNNTGNTISNVSITYKGEQWRCGDVVATPDTLYFGYSYSATLIDSATTGWNAEPNLNFLSLVTSTTGAMDGNATGNNATVTYSFPVSITNGNSFAIRWMDRNMGGSDDGLAVDDFSITFTTTTGPTAPFLLSKTPADNATGVATTVNTLQMTFDQNITLGTGNITLLDLTTPNAYQFPVSSCTVSGANVTVTGVTLNPNISYAVQIPNTAFSQSTGLYYGGINDTTTWNFNTNVNYTPYIQTLVPADNSINVATSTVPTITFDKNVTAGTGSVTIKNLTDNTSQTLTVPSTDVVISGATVTLNNVTLANGKNYAIRYDSTCFVNNGAKALGIYDDVYWNFSTPGNAVTTLNETFTGCASPNFGTFTSYSALGTQTWRCSSFGHNDTNAVYMNGYANSQSNDNEDWLISPAINVSSMNAPYLHFWSKKRFTGTNTKEVLVSDDYTGTGDPNLATWASAGANLSTLDTIWKAFYNAPLSAYKANQFYVAFKYVSAASGTADEWSLDDVNITDGPMSNTTFQNFDGKVLVLGMPKNQLNIMVQVPAEAKYTLTVTDITGKTVIASALTTNAGKNYFGIDVTALNSGMYMLQLQNGSQHTTVKFVK